MLTSRPASFPDPHPEPECAFRRIRLSTSPVLIVWFSSSWPLVHGFGIFVLRSSRAEPVACDALGRFQVVGECVWLLRHGATEWTAEQRHTGARDVSLSDEGREQARQAGKLLAGRHFSAVLVSPQSRAVETCRLAGFSGLAKISADLVEWDYGEYEGLTDDQTQARAPGWDLFRDGAPGGETPAQVAERVARVLATVLEAPGPRLVVSHGKVLRAFAACWIGSEVELGSRLALDTAAVCVLEREAGIGLLRLWNWQGKLPGYQHLRARPRRTPASK